MVINIMITDPTTSSNSLGYTSKNCQASASTDLYPSATLTFSASTFISGVILIPGNN